MIGVIAELTVCIYYWYSSFIMEQPMNVVTFHPQEKWCVMALVTGNYSVVVSHFKRHCTLEQYDVD
jgi:hypothetical protein